MGTTIRVSTSAASSSMPLFGLVAAAAALEAERLGDDADGQRADLAGEAGDDRGGAGAGAAAGAGGDEDHVGALQQALDLVLLLEGGAVADLGVGAGAEAARLLVADVDGDVGDAELQRLKVGVDRHELDPGDAGVDHPVDGVDAGAADADDFDHRLVRLAAAGRLVGRLLAPVARVFRHELLAAAAAAPRRRPASAAPGGLARSLDLALRTLGILVEEGRRLILLERTSVEPASAAGGDDAGPSPAAEGDVSATGPAARAPSSWAFFASAGSSRPYRGASGGSTGASSDVDRKRSDSGPSRMLARLLRRAMRQNLLRQLPVVVRGARSRNRT